MMTMAAAVVERLNNTVAPTLKKHLQTPLNACLEKLPHLSLTAGGTHKAIKQAQNLYIDGDYSGSLLTLEESGLRQIEALNLMGLCLDKLGRTDEGIIMFTEALMLDAENPELLYNIARLYSWNKQPEVSLGYIEFAEALLREQDRCDDDLTYLKATVCEDLGRVDESIALIETLLASSEHAVYEGYLAELLMIVGRYDEAIEKLQLLLASCPDDLSSLALLCKTLGKLGRWDEVLTHCEHWLELSPNDPEACNQLGLAYYAREEYAKAIDYYERALLQAPENTLVLNNLGYTYVKQAQYDKAEETFLTYKGLINEDSPEWEEVEKQLAFIKAKREE